MRNNTTKEKPLVLSLAELENLASKHLSEEITAYVEMPIRPDGYPFTRAELSVTAEKKNSKVYGNVTKHVYRLNGDRISRLAAQLIFAKYTVVAESH
jgi:hypothetical protein